MRRTLRWKLTSSYLLLIFLFSLAVAAALIPAITQFYTAAYTRDILNQARMAARMLERYREEGASLSLLDERANEFAYREGVYVGVRDAGGQPPPTSRLGAHGSAAPRGRRRPPGEVAA